MAAFRVVFVPFNYSIDWINCVQKIPLIRKKRFRGLLLIRNCYDLKTFKSIFQEPWNILFQIFLFCWCLWMNGIGIMFVWREARVSRKRYNILHQPITFIFMNIDKDRKGKMWVAERFKWNRSQLLDLFIQVLIFDHEFEAIEIHKKGWQNKRSFPEDASCHFAPSKLWKYKNFFFFYILSRKKCVL